MYVYREKSVQMAAVGWMAAHWSYRELTSDEEATGDRMDTIGLLGQDLIAIEVKPSVHKGIVFHRDGRGGSLEAKLASTLSDLYAGVTGRQQLHVLHAHWDRLEPLEK
ncbi:hypothetical protein [Rhizobium sp. SL86]|uniref:hypothetical protein n=1 Tax=Rhizobium sp. SL86 TaxID=2995148 RepID=UPI00227567C7|nr:hypothetical protein [Rhizobium sp. SL86]MCY1668492.1 hypothetical protein [Rhizobium sp. SL86]